MKTARIWTGLVMLTGLGITLLYTIVWGHVTRSGLVVGTVLFQGRPVCVGSIFFESEDPGHSESTAAQIDEHGHFECDPDWQRDPVRWTRFRISVVLDRRNVRPDPPPTGSGGGEEVAELIPREAGQGGGDGSISQVMPAKIEAPARDSPARTTEPGRERPRRIVYDQGLAVVLGAEPAHLEIQLRD